MNQQDRERRRGPARKRKKERESKKRREREREEERAIRERERESEEERKKKRTHLQIFGVVDGAQEELSGNVHCGDTANVTVGVAALLQELCISASYNTKAHREKYRP